MVVTEAELEVVARANEPRASPVRSPRRSILEGRSDRRADVLHCGCGVVGPLGRARVIYPIPPDVADEIMMSTFAL